MLQFMRDYKGPLVINGVDYESVKSAELALLHYEGELNIKLNLKIQRERADKVSAPSQQRPKSATVITNDKLYKIKVRQYMTKPSTPDFDFHRKFNDNVPMPMRIMVGKKVNETPGMVRMELWGAITEEQTSHCMKCGKILSNPVSRYFGIGPECGGHNYTNPFNSDRELQQAVNQMKQQLAETKWTGWVIKSAIEEIEEV